MSEDGVTAREHAAPEHTAYTPFSDTIGAGHAAPAGEPGGDGPPQTFVVELPAYSGPLELLLSLIRDERVDVYDIPIARIAGQFLERIHSLKLDEAGD